MTKIKLLSAGLIATAMLATPAMAREHYVAQRHVAAAASTAERDVDGRVCVPAPRGRICDGAVDGDNVPCEPQPF